MYATVQETDAAGKPAGSASLRALSENRFYLFSAEAMSAFCHAIEDLALEEANGSLWSTIQNFKNFEPHRERYGQLAITIDRVEVLAAGPPPRRTRRIRFVKDCKGWCKDFWIVLYEGHRQQALVMGRQVNKAAQFDDKRFVGFYTFDAGLINRVRRDLQEATAGRIPALREFWRLHAIDHAAKQISTEFSREKEAVSRAVRRLQLEAGRYRAGHFASDLEKGLSRLHQWKTRLPEILARAEGS